MTAVVGDGAVNGEADGVDGGGVELSGEGALAYGLLHDEVAFPAIYEERDGQRIVVERCEPMAVVAGLEEFYAVALSGVV